MSTNSGDFPTRFPDLTPLDFFLWAHLKNEVYSRRPLRNIEELQLYTTDNRAVLQRVNAEFRRIKLCTEKEGAFTEA